jgi:RTA1 like protein
LQSAGGAIADTAGTVAVENTGTNVMVAGLSFQVISLTAFILLCTEFFWKVKKDKKQVAATNWADRDTGRPNPEVKGFHVFLGGKLLSSPYLLHMLINFLAFAAATILILVRSCFRVAELAHGFRGKLANDQVIFMILEGGVMILATFLLTAFAPGRYVGKEWKNSGWGIKKGNTSSNSLEKGGSGSEAEGERLQSIPV